MTTAAAAGSGRSGGGGSSSSSSSYSPLMLNLLAGGGAGVVETVMTYPLDLVRTRVQMAQAGAGGGSVLGLLRAIVETEGGLRRLYRGMLPPLVSEVPRRALKFTANDAYTRVLVGDGGGGKLSTGAATLAGALVGMTETVFHTPFETCKIRMQAKEFAHCRNSWDCARDLLRLEGVLSFYRGFEAYIYRQGLWNGAYFGLIAAIRQAWPPPAPPQPGAGPRGGETTRSQSRMAYDFWTGLTAGSLATVFNTPFDCAKTHIQCMQRQRSPWCLPYILGMYREGGVRACFRGLAARLYRAAPGSGILLVGYEAIKGWLTA